MPQHVVGACALDCPDACSWVVTVEDGRAIALRGNDSHPFTRGGLCAKVNPYLDYAASPDRLLHPLRRVGRKGEGRFVQISWDDALAELAERIREAIAAHGAESIWPYAGTGSVSLLQGLGGAGQRLFHHLGASRHHGNICSPAGRAGMLYTTGTPMGMDPEDLAASGLIVLWGTNTLTTNLHLWPFVTRGRRAGAPLVVVDPVRTRTAAQADRHLALLPGTDAALALGLMAHLVERGATDDDYLARNALGWPRFRDEVLVQWSTDRAASVCGLDEPEVRWFADAIADHGPVGIRTLMGMQRHGGGAQALRVLSCIPALTGDYGRHGGGMCYSTGAAYGWNEAALNRPDLQPNGPTRRLKMASLGRELLERTDPPVDVLMIWAANPVVSNPDQNRVREGLSREDLFTVVVEHTATDTTDYADLVLPGTTQLEHNDLTESYTHLYVQWNAPAVAPPGECLPHTEIFRRLAGALGVDEPAVLASDEELARDALDSPAPALSGITVESLQRNGWQRLNLPQPYLPYADRFATPSGRFEFVSARAAAAGFGELPGYTPPHEALGAPTARHAQDVDDEGLALISAANHYLINATFTGSPLHSRSGSPVLVLHPKDAAHRSIEDGVQVRVSNERGSFTATAQVSDRTRVGVAATSKGLSPGRGGSSVNATTADRESDLGSGATFHDNRVWVTPLG